MNQIKRVLPVVFVFLAGVAGGIFRGIELTECYDDITGLYTAGPVTYVLLCFSAVVAVLCLLLALLKKKITAPYPVIYHCGVPGAMFCMLAGVIMIVAGFMRLISFFSDGRYASLFFGILTVLCGVSFIALSAARKRGSMPEMTGLGAVVTVFWACFMLIFVFMEHPVEPVELLYLYDLLAMCCALLSIYAVVAQLFDRDRMRIALFSSLGAVFFLTVSGLGRLMTFFYSGSFHFITQVDFRLVVYASLLLYCVSNATSLLMNVETEAQEDNQLQ